MSGILRRMFLSDDWKRVFAWTCVYGFAYNVIFWPLAFWATTIGTQVTGAQWPGPPLVPWEQLAAMTGMLAVVGGVQIMRDKVRHETDRAPE